MPARGTQMTFWLAIGIAAIASTAGAAVKPCSRHRCRAAIAASCEGLHRKAKRGCTRANRKAISAACRAGLCSCDGGAESTCALGPETTTTTSTTAPNTVTPTSTTAPTTARPTSTTAPTTATPTSTTAPTTTTLPGGGASNPGAGLQSQITGARVTAAGTVVVTFTLTDAAGVPVIPVTTATSAPHQAQVRFTIARLELDAETERGFTTTFTRYLNYNTPRPGYDSGGTLATVDSVAGTYTYTFQTPLPPGFPGGLTHTVGGQVTRPFDGAMLVANPVFDFVPAGGPVTTVREVTTTAQCNGCHDPLEAHGGARREVKLCQLCHTEQLTDASTGNSAEFQNMIHRLHRGQDLPSIVDGAVGAKYSFGNTVFAEKVKACVGGALAGLTCTADADCTGGTCTGSTTTGVTFPQDIRTCTLCHTEGATASD